MRELLYIGGAMMAAALAAGCPDHDHGDHADDHGDHADGHGGHADEHGDPSGEVGEGERERTVQISTEAIERNDIRIGTVEETVLGGGVEAPAEVQIPPGRLAHVTPVSGGRLSRVRATVGDRVAEGDPLAVLESMELGEARSALERARADVEEAEARLERQQALQEEGIGAERELEEARGDLARARAERSSIRSRLSVYGRGGQGASTVVRSPIDGVVVERHATVGETVGPRDRLFEVADPGIVWVVGRVYPRDVARVSEGARAVLRLDAVPAERWEGTLEYVAPTLDPRTRTMPVRMVVENESGELRPGLFGTLSITPASNASDPVPAVEANAVTELDGEAVVFVPLDDDGKFEARPIETGARGDDRVEVRKGLSAGDRYVVSGAFVLKSQLQRGRISGHH